MILVRVIGAVAVVAAMATGVAAWAPSPQAGDASRTAQAEAQAALIPCSQAHPLAERTIDAADRRLEAARQSNSPSAMRAAIDDLQAALRQLRADIAPCAGLESMAPADPHAGHVMPEAARTPPAAAPETPTPSAAPMPAAEAPAAPPAVSAPPGPIITFRSVPDPPRGAVDNEFEVTVTDRQGKPIDGAEVSVALFMAAMPAMKMPEMRNAITLTGVGNGRYTGKGQIMMAGPWSVTVSVRQNGKEIGQQKVTITAR